MNVLVTGSEGLIGRSLCRQLEERGDMVWRFDLAFGEDILDKSKGIPNDSSFDAIIHLAAQSGVEAARSNARAAWELNVMGTLNVLEAAREHNIPVVVASSNHVYGDHGGEPTDENASLDQLDTYSATKIAADVMARSYWHNYGLPVAVVRNTNCFGPDSPHTEHLIEGTILSCINGEDMQFRTNGETKKAYLYVDDAAAAYITVMDALVEGTAKGQAYNVTGSSVRAIDVANMVIKQMGSKIRLRLGDDTLDQADENLDDSKLRALGWAPKVPLEEGIRRTIQAYTQRYSVVA